MTVTSAPASSPAWSGLAARVRSMAAATAHLSGMQLLHATTVVVTTAVAVLAMVNAATSLYWFAVRYEASTAAAIMLTAAVLGLYTAITASAWRVRLHGGRLPRLMWVLWGIAVGVGLAATAGAATSHSWIAQAINAVPMAALAAVTGLVTRPARP